MQILEIRDNKIYVDDNIKAQLKKYEEEKTKYDLLKGQIIEDMEEIQNTIGLETYNSEDLKISYVKPTQTITIQKDKLKEEFPEAYNCCQKTTVRKGSFRINLHI